jgi:hypothetical protein
MQNNKRKLDEFINGVQLQLKKFKTETPEETKDIEAIETTLNQVMRHRLAFQYRIFCQDPNTGEKNLLCEYEYEFQDLETYDTMNKDPKTMIGLFEKEIFDQEGYHVQEDAFDSIENLTEEQLVLCTLVTREQAGLGPK